MILPALANYDWRFSYNGSPTRANPPLAPVGVGTYPPNAFGLYDMHGNVWEWVDDAWRNGYDTAKDMQPDGAAPRVLRGGSWYDFPGVLRSAFRFSFIPDDRYALSVSAWRGRFDGLGLYVFTSWGSPEGAEPPLVGFSACRRNSLTLCARRMT